MSSLKNKADIRFHMVITSHEIGSERDVPNKIQHLSQDWDSPNMAKSFLENAVKDELEVLNDCRLHDLGEAIVMRFFAKYYENPDGQYGYIICDKQNGKAFVASYSIVECETKNSRDGRPRWFYRGYIINTNGRKNRFCVTKDDEKLAIRNLLTAALLEVDYRTDLSGD